MSDYNFTRISKNFYSKIRKLYSLAFALNETEENIEKKYDTSLFGLRDIGVLALTKDESPAAYYGVFPIKMRYHGEDILAAQSGDTMTSPYHQKKGLFTQLAKETYKLAAENKVSLVYGFPNENSYPGFKNKLDWHFTGFLQNYSIINSTLPICELVYKYKAIKGIYNSFVHFRLSKYILKSNRENTNKLNTEISAVKKDSLFLTYKMRSSDVYFIQINNFTLLIKVNNHLQIGAVGKFEKSELPNFIKTIKKLGTMLFCRRTILALSKNHWLNLYLETILLPSNGMPIGFYIIDKSIVTEDFTFTLADFDTF